MPSQLLHIAESARWEGAEESGRPSPLSVTNLEALKHHGSRDESGHHLPLSVTNLEALKHHGSHDESGRHLPLSVTTLAALEHHGSPDDFQSLYLYVGIQPVE
jgi:hypothetical protein